MLPDPPHSRHGNKLQVLLFVLAVAGFGINLMLLVKRLGDDSSSLAGCGPGSGCETVLGSQWSQVLGVPVTVPGLLIYVWVMLAITRAGRAMLAPALGVIFAAVVWFLFVQAFLIRAFCPWCMAAHAVGIALCGIGVPYAARSVGGWKNVLLPFFSAAIPTIVLLALIQTYGPRPASHRLTEFGAVDAESQLTEDPHSAGEGRLAVFFDGTKGYRVAELPYIGRADARHVLVEYFDYGCSACQTMAGHLDALVTAYPDDICVILLPMPMDRECNPLMPPLETGHAGACAMARAALAIWRHSRENFHAFHRAVLSDPNAENANMLAAALLEDPEASMRDPWIQSIIETNIADWQILSADNPKLPKLVVDGRTVMHGFPPTRAEFIQVIAGRLGLEN